VLAGAARLGVSRSDRRPLLGYLRTLADHAETSAELYRLPSSTPGGVFAETGPMNRTG
jgi:hypothetical protein